MEDDTEEARTTRVLTAHIVPQTASQTVGAEMDVVTTDDTAGGAETIQADLLTQAMSELTQSLSVEYRQQSGDYHVLQQLPAAATQQANQGKQ